MAEQLIGSMPEALARAYEYLRRIGGGAADLATAPVRLVGRGVGQGADLVANTLAGVLGAERENPSAMADLAGLDKSGNAIQSAINDVRNLRNPVINALGWRDVAQPGALAQVQPNVQPIITPAGFQEDTGASPSVLPPQRRVVVPMRSGGALPATQPDITPAGYQEDTGVQPSAQPPAVAPVVPVAPQLGLRDQFLQRLAGMDKTPAKTGMTEEQKGQALMEAGLAIMSAASRPGASAMGAVGQGGMQGTAVAREMEKINREQADKRRAEDRANVGTEFTLAGKDQEQAMKQADLASRAEDRKVNRVLEEKKLGILSQQVEAAGWQLKDSADGVVHAYNVRTGEDRKTPLKVKPDASQRNQQVEFYRFLMDNPQAQQLFTKSDTIDMKDEGKRRAAYGQAYLKASMDPISDISKFPTFEEYSAKMGIGGNSAGGPPKFNTVAEAQAAKKAGKIKTGDTIMTPNGPIVVR